MKITYLKDTSNVFFPYIIDNPKDPSLKLTTAPFSHSINHLILLLWNTKLKTSGTLASSATPEAVKPPLRRP